MLKKTAIAFLLSISLLSFPAVAHANDRSDNLYQQSDELRQNVSDELAAYKDFSDQLISSLIKYSSESDGVLSNDDTSYLLDLEDKMFTNLNDAIRDDSSASLAYFKELFAGDADNDSYKDIEDSLSLSCKSKIDKLNAADEVLLDTLADAFTDLQIDSSETLTITRCIMSFDDLYEELSGFNSADASANSEIDYNSMSDLKKRLLRISVDCAIYDKKNNIDESNYSDIISRDLSNFSLDELETMQNELKESEKNSSLSELSPISEKFSAEISTNYIVWLEAFGVSGSNLDVEYSEPDENGNISSRIDSLNVQYDVNTMKAKSALLFFKNSISMNALADMQKKRALAFFAALEYGAPMNSSENDWTAVMETMQKIFDKIPDCASKHEEDLKDGKYVLFYGSENTSYYLKYFTSKGLCIFAQ